MSTFDLKKFLVENKLTINSRILYENEEQRLRELLGKNYETFVKELGANVKDEKFLQAIKNLANKAPIETTSITPKVTELKPTQNEIDLDKSLGYPLKNAADLKKVLSGGVQSPGGNSIVTAGGGKYIVDGHHRWSQVYAINPKASIKALDIGDTSSPAAALKSTQLGIAASSGNVPVQSVQGTNLLEIDKSSLEAYINKVMTPEVLNVFKEFKLANDNSGVIEYIWKNIESMKKTSMPVQGAPKRDFMPQTDTAPNWIKDAPKL